MSDASVSLVTWGAVVNGCVSLLKLGGVELLSKVIKTSSVKFEGKSGLVRMVSEVSGPEVVEHGTSICVHLRADVSKGPTRDEAFDSEKILEIKSFDGAIRKANFRRTLYTINPSLKNNHAST